MTFYLIWGLVTFVSNCSFTAVSRARNSGSYSYHTLASMFSNGVWWLGQVFVVGLIAKALINKDMTAILTNGLFYTAAATSGSVFAHYVLAKYVETGKRKVGG